MSLNFKSINSNFIYADTNRAANHILRMTLSGQIVMTLLPPGFVAKEDSWQTHEGISDVEAIKALGISEDLVEVDENFDSDSDNEDGEIYFEMLINQIFCKKKSIDLLSKNVK